jgi:uncharacterized protein YbjQ (UPF0145 family)
MSIADYTGGSSDNGGVLVITNNDVPGHDVKQVIGEVFGLTVCTRHAGAQIGAGLRT